MATQERPEPLSPLHGPLLDLVQAIHGPVQGEDLERVSGTIEALRRSAAALAAYRLTNADEPAPTFAVYRAD
jgi:hypothetical protein